MPTKIPTFPQAGPCFVSPKTGKALGRAIESRTPLAGDGLLSEDVLAGVVLRVDFRRVQRVVVDGPPDGSGSGGGSSTPSHSDSSDSSGPSDSGSPSTSGKFAIVPFVTPAGVVEWIGWQCVERPQGIFEEVYDVPVHRGTGFLYVPEEHVQSCEPGSLRVTSRMAVERPAWAHAAVEQWGDVCALRVRVRKVAWWHRPVRTVRVRVEGVRCGCGEAWPRFSEAQATSNAAWHRSALELR